MNSTACKVLTPGQWAEFEAKGVFHGAPVDISDGYIHLSTADQLQGTLDKHFAGHRELIIAEIDLAALSSAVRWEVSRGGAKFPHVYGSIPMSAVVLVNLRQFEPVEPQKKGVDF